ncbi:MAG: hypothetical protein ACYCZN_03455 [Candidatus Dormibacteria bacterium]
MKATFVRKILAVAGVVGVLGVAAALSGATVLAWKGTDFSSTTQTYTSPGLPGDGSYGSASSTATVGQYLTDSQTVTVTGFSYLSASDFQFALYAGTPAESCPTTGDRTSLPSGYVFESGVISEAKTGPGNGRSSFSFTVNSSQAATNGSYQIPAGALGPYYWIASYSDTREDITILSPCEPVTVSQATPTMTTALSSSSITVGQSVSDTATLTGATTTAGGTVTYNVYNDSSCSSLDVTAGQVSVTSGSVPSSSPLTFNTVGTYYWQAAYSGDPDNAPATSPCNSEQNEELTVVRTAPTITTALSASSITVGGSVFDTARLDGATGDAGGDVVYMVYDNNSCSAEGPSIDSDLAAGAPRFTVAGSRPGGTVTVADGAVPDSETLNFNTAGSYDWQAVYLGDGNNGYAVSPCEPLTVSSPPPPPPPPNTPSLTTAPSAGGPVGTALSDTAYVTGIVSPAGADNVTFGLYSDAACNSLLDNLGSGALTGPTSPNGVATWTASSPGTGYPPAVAGTYYWGVTFNSVNDSANLSSSMLCGEPVTITTSSGTLGAHTTPTPAGAVQAATTPVPNTGAGLLLPGLPAALAILFGGLLLLTGARLRRHPSR